MTDIVDSTPPANGAAPEETEPERKLDSSEAVQKAILEDSGLDAFNEIPLITKAWAADPVTGKRVAVIVGGDNPIDTSEGVAAIFHDAESLRFYTLPKEKGAPRRYTFTSAGVTATALSVEQFVDLVSGEFRDVSDEFFGEDDDAPPADGVTS